MLGRGPADPGHPDRRTCQYGGVARPGSAATASRAGHRSPPEDAKYTGDLGDYAYTGIPFVATNPDGIVDEKLAPD